MSERRPCPDCGVLFAPKGKAALCNSCGAMANVIIRSMMAQGCTSREMATALNLSEVAVHRRRERINAESAKRPAPIVAVPPAVVARVEVVVESKPRPEPAKRVCAWPTHDDPSRDMHVCCRPAPVLACGGDDLEDDLSHTLIIAPTADRRPREGSARC